MASVNTKAGAASAPASPAQPADPAADSAPWFWRVARAAWHVVRFGPVLFFGGSFLLLIADFIGLCNVQLLSTLTAGLSGQSGAASGGLFGGILPAPQNVTLNAWLFLILVIVSAMLRFWQRRVSARSENDTLAQLRLELHNRLLTMAPIFHRQNAAENLAGIVTAGAQNANILFRQLLAAPITQFIPLVAAIVFIYFNLNVMKQQNGYVLAGLFLMLISLPILGWFFSKLVNNAFRQAGDRGGELTIESANSLARPEEIQLMDALAQRQQIYEARLLAQASAQTRATVVKTLASQVEDVIPAVVQAAFLLYGAYAATGNPAAAGAIIGLYLLGPTAVNPLKTVVDLFAGVGGSRAIVGSVLLVLEAKPAVVQEGVGVDLTPGDRTINLRDVVLTRPNAAPVLDHVSVDFEAGKITAIVGHSGAGKSTVLNLIAGLSPPESGTILIGDKSVPQIATHSLHTHIAKVSQEPLLITATVRDNFKLVKADATDAEIEDASRQTGLWDVLVRNQPGGTPLDAGVLREAKSGGGGLSGGERRLLAVSRALLLRPPILLLDEPTTGLDAGARRSLCEMIKRVFKGTTIVLVDHNMEFVSQLADEVCCLDGGKIVGSGPPDILRGRDSLFAELLQDELYPMRKAAAQTRTVLEWTDLIKTAESAAEFLVAFDLANQALAEFPDDVGLRYLAVRTLARGRAPQLAAKLYDRHHLGHDLTDDVAALHARILKDEARQASGDERVALWRQAGEAYADVFRRSPKYYQGINAATLFTLAGDTARAAPIIEATQKDCEADKPTTPLDIYYREATLAELALLQGDTAAAEAALTRAAPPGFSDWAAMATTRQQLTEICQFRGLPMDVLKPLQAPPILFYLGHMISPAGTPGRFPADQEKGVAERIADYLKKNDIRVAYGSLACGADILFAEALLARKGELHVVLPFELEEFRRISVLRGGEGWGKRFDDCLACAKSVTYATDDAYLDDNSLFPYAAHFAMGLAVLRGKYLGAEVRQVAVWDGMARTGNAGTAADIDYWRGKGEHTDVIAVIRSPDFDTGAVAAVDAREDAMPHRRTHAMLFGDFHGYSALHERDIPVFQDTFMRAIAEVLKQFGDAVLYRNTWGDAIYVVLSDPVQGARCALAIQNRMARLERGALPVKPELRLAGHFGPTFVGYDNVRGEKTFFGAHVTRAARLEPITPTNLVYITEAFAAALTMEDTPDLSCEYVGQLPAAKNYGTMPMYLLRAMT